MLHVLNGESMVSAWKTARLPGRAVVWGEMLMEGPLAPDLASVRDERASWFEKHVGVPRAEFLAESERAAAALDATGKEDTVVLWFEQDLFCHVNLAYALTRLAATGAGVELVLPERPLGACAAHQLAALFATRQSLSAGMVDLAPHFWQAYASDEPEALAALSRGDLAPWPGLARGVQLALARLPGPDGLDVVDRAVLRTLGAGSMTFKALFSAVMREASCQGLGTADQQFAMQLRELAATPEPLLRMDGADVLTSRIGATPQGFAALHGRADVVRTRGIDRWRGGVHLAGRGPVWRWDGRALAMS